MIEIEDITLGIVVNLDGKIKETPRKVNYQEIVSIRGVRFTEQARGVIDLSLDITYIDEDNYKKLQDIFLYSNNSLSIENLDKGKMYKNYYIQGDSMSLDEYEDIDNQVYYYKGTLILNKR